MQQFYRQEIWPKVNVTWRDIQREFEQVSLGEEILQGSEDVERTEIVLSALQSGISLGNIDAAKGSGTLGMIRLPKEDPLVPLVYDELGNFEVRIKARDCIHSYMYDYHPLDIVGWDDGRCAEEFLLSVTGS